MAWGLKRKHDVIKVGLCGFTIGAREYFETFPVLEVQQTFYEPPAPRTLVRWREQAGDGFEFTIKAWQLITHRSTSNTYRRLKTPLTDAERAQCGAFQTTPVVMKAWKTTLACARLLHATASSFNVRPAFAPSRRTSPACGSFSPRWSGRRASGFCGSRAVRGRTR
jgi:uncharacterized protein YecE (DUF72 family)